MPKEIVNVENPEFNENTEGQGISRRVIAIIDDEGDTARVHSGKHVQIRDDEGNYLPGVIPFND